MLGYRVPKPTEAHVDDRRGLQGMKSPRGSGRYLESTWLGMVKHDHILYDHGIPVQSSQSPDADVEIEFQAGSRQVESSRRFAEALRVGNANYAKDYPVKVADDMCCKDSVHFQDFSPSVSI